MEVRAPAYITERIIFQFPPLFVGSERRNSKIFFFISFISQEIKPFFKKNNSYGKKKGCRLKLQLK